MSVQRPALLPGKRLIMPEPKTSSFNLPSLKIPGAEDAAAPVPRAEHSLALPQTGFVRQRLLLRFVPFSKSTLWRRVKAGEFPAPIRLSVGITAWRAEDVRLWISGRS
ncbi:MAG TPA: AlpA family phage regulatory protein [Burkholderiaceae bacterium]|nr:AlpA family phage regulatory protein [Burkholderiaceae bacterium]